MLLFLGTILEQLDVALEHVQKRDVHNARFALMLTDNVVELVLHQISKDRAGQLKMYAYQREEYPHTEALEKALKRSFHTKIKFAKLETSLTEEVAQTLSIIHDYRNEVYHVGLEHEEILSELAAFHFDVTCRFVERFEPYNMYWGSNMKLPSRSQKYFTSDGFMPGGIDHFKAGCKTLRDACGHDPAAFVECLADHMDSIVALQDSCLDIVAGGVYANQKRTRNQAIIETQAWSMIFREEGRKFAADNGFAGGNPLVFRKWIVEHYPWKYRSDPIEIWRGRAETLRGEKNPHSALNRYHSFMEETAQIREDLYESAAAAEREIDAAIDRARGK